eukprot:CAMPEP_0181382708 /NCGR_PEP_ID=MMETSP1106-20121128/20906_1 /TAXON_ID=81844 /ORGANISM="Mantoniella antarctica, Strain SL-175" /LENGTH=70 /DNA_ID=CAMNT_0023502191 /DNA_START=50 /DNA_END=258 /DNA_ORIENTATION=-
MARCVWWPWSQPGPLQGYKVTKAPGADAVTVVSTGIAAAAVVVVAVVAANVAWAVAAAVSHSPGERRVHP